MKMSDEASVNQRDLLLQWKHSAEHGKQNKFIAANVDCFETASNLVLSDRINFISKSTTDIKICKDTGPTNVHR